MIPSKKIIVQGLIVSAIALLVYNKVPAVRRMLGGA